MSSQSQVTGSQIIAEFLSSQQVEKVFCITGAGNLAIVDALELTPGLQVIYSHHEQAAAMEAQGYARVSGKPGVVLVTTGGGTSNVVTGVLSAQMDSVPLLLITGNESSFHCEEMVGFRAFGVQGFDSCAVLSPITKHSSRVLDERSLTQELKMAWHVMESCRPGVAHIDVPMDIQRKLVPSQAPTREHITIDPFLEFDEPKLNELLADLTSSKRPMLYLGNGIRSSAVRTQLKELWDAAPLPYFLSWSALDLVEESARGNMGRIGIYGDRAANITLQRADLVIAIGTRLAIPQVGYDKRDFARHAKKWVIDIDKLELSKFDFEGWSTLHADGREVFQKIIDKLRAESGNYSQWSSWVHSIQETWNALPRNLQVGPPVRDPETQVHSIDVMQGLNRTLPDDAIVVTDVGAALCSGHYALEIRGTQRVFTSQGLGEMGFGLPAAIGAWFADHGKVIVCLNTDGAIMMNLQELQLVQHFGIPLKLFIFNNEGYGMIKNSQESLFEGRLRGVGPTSGLSLPDFSLLAKTFGLEYAQMFRAKDIDSILRWAFESPRAVLIEVRMDPDQRYLPRLATSKSKAGTFVSPPLEDLDPKLDLDTLEGLLGYKAHPDSYASRGVAYD